MLVCHCKVVTDRGIRAEIARGARDEFDVAQRCGAGSVCGGCVPAITRLLVEAGVVASITPLECDGQPGSGRRTFVDGLVGPA